MPAVTLVSVTDNGDGTYDIQFDGPATWNGNGAEETSIIMYDSGAHVWYNTQSSLQVDPNTIQMNSVPPTPNLAAFLIYYTPSFIVFDSPPTYASIAVGLPFP